MNPAAPGRTSAGCGRLDGKVAIVTGGGAGIGAACADAFASEGARVVVADLDPAAAERVAEGIRARGGDAVPVRADVADDDQVSNMVSTAVAAYGRLDILHNNAAAVSAAHLAGDRPVAEVDLDNWDRTMAVNVRGVLLGCRAAVPVMIDGGGGAIINSSSRSGTFGGVHRTAYGVSKAAVEHLTLDVAVQYGKRGIRCNALVIFGIVTDNSRASLDDAGAARRLAMALTPRLGAPEDVANAAVFLASDESSYITGHLLAVDGGMHAGSPKPWDLGAGDGEQRAAPVADHGSATDQTVP